MPAAYAQLRLGACTGNAVAGGIEYNNILDGCSFGTPSRLDIYYGERAEEGTVDQDAGAFGRDGFRFAHRVGVIPESDWPYDVSKFAVKPPADEGRRFRIRTYKAVPRGILSFKRVFSNRQTIAFGFSVFESFESDETASSGIMPVPGPGERMVGGHEVLGCGYLEKYPHHLLVRNSWGTDWGMGGYFLMPWSVIMDRNLSSDFRTIYRPAA